MAKSDRFLSRSQRSKGGRLCSPREAYLERAGAVRKDRIAKQKFHVTLRRHGQLACVRSRFADFKRRVQSSSRIRATANLHGLPAAGKEGGGHEEDTEIARKTAEENRKDEPADGQASSAPGARRRGREQEAGGPSSAAFGVVCLFLESSPKRAGWSGVLHPPFLFASTDRPSSPRLSEKRGQIPSNGLEFRNPAA